jgi:transposase
MKSISFVGVDVSKAALDIAVEGTTASVQIANNTTAIRRWLRGMEPCCIGVESTGSYHQLLTRLAITSGHTVYVLSPRDLSHYARAVGRRAKTDRLDAQLIARYLHREHEHLHPYQLPTEIQAQFDALIKRRHTAVVSQGMLRQSFAELRVKPRGLATTLRAIEKLIVELDRSLQQLVLQDPQLSPVAKRLRSMVGFGPLLSATMANAITRKPYKHSDAFVASLGLDPRARDSGQRRGRRYLSKRGPAELRRLVFVGAMSACKTKLWRPIYERYRNRGLPSTAVLVIIARKLARIAFSIVKHGTTFNPNLVKCA